MEVALHGPRPRRVHDLVHEEEEDGPTQPLEQTPQVALGSTRERLFPRRTISSPGSPRYAASATTAPSSCSSSPSSAAIYVWSPLHVPSPSPRAPLAAPLVLPPAQQRLQFRTIRHARRPLWTSLIVAAWRQALGQEHFGMEISNLCGGVFSLEIRKLRESRPSSSGCARKAKGSGAQGSDVLREAPRSSEPKRPGEGRTAR